MNQTNQTKPHIAPDPTEYALGDEPREPQSMSKRAIAARKRATRASRRQEAFALRRAGESFENIGRHLGVSPQTVSIWVREAIANVPQEEADELRKMELTRLDAVLVPQMRLAIAGDGYAVDRVLKIMERRSKYLNLDAATTAGIREVGTLLDRLVFGGDEEDAE